MNATITRSEADAKRREMATVSRRLYAAAKKLPKRAPKYVREGVLDSARKARAMARDWAECLRVWDEVEGRS